MSVDFVQDSMPVNSGSSRHVHPNHLKERLWCRLKKNTMRSPKPVPSVEPRASSAVTSSTAAIRNVKYKWKVLLILVAAVIGIFSSMPGVVYAADPVWEGTFFRYGKGGQTVAGAVKKTAAGNKISLETLKSYIGMQRSEIPYDIDPVKHGNYYDTVKKDFIMYGYKGKISFVFKANAVVEACWESGEIKRDDVNKIMKDFSETIVQYEYYYKGEKPNSWNVTSDYAEYCQYYIESPEHDSPLTVIIGATRPEGGTHYNEYGNPDWFKAYPYWKHSSGKYVCCVTGSTGSDLTFDFSDGVYLRGDICSYVIEPDRTIKYSYKKGWAVRYDPLCGRLISICDPQLTNSGNQGIYYPISKEEYKRLRASL